MRATWLLENCTENIHTVNYIRLTRNMELRTWDKLCVDFWSNPPLSTACHYEGGTQRTRYSLASKKLSDNNGLLCLTKMENSDILSWTNCHSNVGSQESNFKTVFDPNLIL